MASNAIDNLATQQATGLTILCAADRDAQFDLYEDDGASMDYENGKYLRTKISLTAGESTFLEFKNEGEYETAVETIAIDMIHREKAPYWVSLDGEQLPHFLHRRKFEEAECGWYYSQRLKSVQVKYGNPKKEMCIRDSRGTAITSRRSRWILSRRWPSSSILSLIHI